MSDATPPKQLGFLIKAIRESVSMNQTDFAAAITTWLREHGSNETVTQPVISSWERGEFRPTDAKVRAIAAVGRTDARELLALRAGVTDDETPAIDPIRGEFADLPDEDYEQIRRLGQYLRERNRE